MPSIRRRSRSERPISVIPSLISSAPNSAPGPHTSASGRYSGTPHCREGFLDDPAEFVVKAVVVEGLEQYKWGQTEEPFEEITKDFTLVEASQVQTVPDAQDRLDQMRAAAERFAAGIDLVKGGLSKNLECRV
jgi:hypothetical protein